jgi:hypothetical protein
MALATASAGEDDFSPEAMRRAMRWELWNPWARWYELGSTHPLPAKRIAALERAALAMGIRPSFSLRQRQPESYLDEFVVDLFAKALPATGFVVGMVILGVGGPVPRPITLGLAAIAWGFALWSNRRFRYPGGVETPRRIAQLVGRVKVSAVRAVPGNVSGRIVGRGVPGLFYGWDLVLHDGSGFITLSYTQPSGLWMFLFGWLKAGSLVGKSAYGWYRRDPGPRFELRQLDLDEGGTFMSFTYPVGQFAVWALMLGGMALVAGDLLLGLG